MLVLIPGEGLRRGERMQTFGSLSEFDNWAKDHHKIFDDYDCFYFKNRSYSQLKRSAYDKTVKDRIARVREKWKAKAGAENIR